MKSFEIKALGLEEVSTDEIVNTNGGVVQIPWLLYEILMALGDVAMGVSVGMLLHDSLHKDVEEVYYGGEIEAAVCIG